MLGTDESCSHKIHLVPSYPSLYYFVLTVVRVCVSVRTRFHRTEPPVRGAQGVCNGRGTGSGPFNPVALAVFGPERPGSCACRSA